MPLSTRLKWPIPSEGQSPWYDAFLALVNKIDASVFASREDRHIVLMEGGTVSFVASTNTLSWDGTIEVLAGVTGFHWDLGPQSVSILDGEMMYIDVSRSPTQNTVVTPQVAKKIPSTDAALLLCIRRGSEILWRDGFILTDGVASDIFTSSSVGLDIATGDARYVLKAGDTMGGALRFPDNTAVELGTGGDATIQYDGTNLLINPAAVGAGDLYIGNGSTAATPEDIVLHGTGGLGLNVSGAQVTIAGGRSTGNAAGGSVLIQTSAPGASGSSLNALVDRLELTDVGEFIVNGAVGGAGQVLVSGGSGSAASWQNPSALTVTLQDAYDDGNTIDLAGGLAVDLTHDSTVSATNYALDLNWPAVAYTGTPHGLRVDMSNATSITTGTDVFGARLIGRTNAGAGDTVGLEADAGWDIGIRSHAPVYVGNADVEGNSIDISGSVSSVKMKISQVTDTDIELLLHTHSSAVGPVIVGARSRADATSHTAVATNDDLLQLLAVGWDGTQYTMGARILMEVDTGTVGALSMPGRILFSTSPDGGAGPVERMRIAQDGLVTMTERLLLDGTGVSLSGGVDMLNVSLPASVFTGSEIDGVVVDFSGATSISAGSDFYGMRALGQTNGDVADSIGIGADAGWDIQAEFGTLTTADSDAVVQWAGGNGSDQSRAQLSFDGSAADLILSIQDDSLGDFNFAPVSSRLRVGDPTGTNAYNTTLYLHAGTGAANINAQIQKNAGGATIFTNSGATQAWRFANGVLDWDGDEWNIDGSEGTAGQVLASNGPGLSPTWQDASAVTSLQAAYDGGNTIQIAGGNAIDITHGATAGTNHYAMRLQWSGQNYTGLPRGILVDTTGAVSFSNAGSFYGVELRGDTNAGAGESFALSTDHGWDVQLEIGQPTTAAEDVILRLEGGDGVNGHRMQISSDFSPATPGIDFDHSSGGTPVSGEFRFGRSGDTLAARSTAILLYGGPAGDLTYGRIRKEANENVTFFHSDATRDWEFSNGNWVFTGANFDLDPTGPFTVDMDAGQTATVTISDNLTNAFRVTDGTNTYFAAHSDNTDERVVIGSSPLNPEVRLRTTDLVSAGVIGTNASDGNFALVGGTGVNQARAHLYYDVAASSLEIWADEDTAGDDTFLPVATAVRIGNALGDNTVNRTSQLYLHARTGGANNNFRLNMASGTLMQQTFSSASGVLVQTNGTYQFQGTNFDLDPTGTFALDMDAGQTATVTVSDNLTNAFGVFEGANQYFTITTANSAEVIRINGSGVGNVWVGTNDNDTFAFQVFQSSNNYIAVHTTNTAEEILFGDAAIDPRVTLETVGLIEFGVRGGITDSDVQWRWAGGDGTNEVRETWTRDSSAGITYVFPEADNGGLGTFAATNHTWSFGQDPAGANITNRNTFIDFYGADGGTEASLRIGMQGDNPRVFLPAASSQALNIRNAADTLSIATFDGQNIISAFQRRLRVLVSSTPHLDVNAIGNAIDIGPTTVDDTITVNFADDNAAGFVLQERTGNSYLTIDTTNTTEIMRFGNTTTNPDYEWIGTGFLRGREAAASAGSALNLRGGDGTGTNQAGGDLVVRAGDGTGTGVGGDITITGGDSGTGNTGAITITTADATTPTSIYMDDFTPYGQFAVPGAGGELNLQAETVTFGGANPALIDTDSGATRLQIGQVGGEADQIHIATEFWHSSHSITNGREVRRFTGEGQTTNATPTNILTVDLLGLSTSTQAFWVTVRIVAADTGGTDRAMYHKAALLYNNSGNVALQGSVQDLATDVETTGSMDGTIGVSTDFVVVTVTGIALTTINWACELTYQRVDG